MRSLVLLLALLAASTLWPLPANAACTCQCVNGNVQPVCSSSLAVPPICAPRVCPIVPPAVTPIMPPTVPPIGTKECKMVQVYNNLTRQYEWKKICR
jgi:hypothetical protein